MLKIVISYPTAVPNEIGLVNELLASDINYFHIRKPDFTDIDLTSYIESIDEENHHKIMISSCYGIANNFSIAGIHLNKKSRNRIVQKSESQHCHVEPILQDRQQILINNQVPSNISYSAHSFQEIAEIDFKTNYIFLAPIFNSISKTDYPSKFTNHSQLQKELTNTSKKIIALGGVRAEQSTQLEDLGFYGYALLGDYWQKYLK